LNNGLIKEDTCLVLEFLCEDKGHQKIVDDYLNSKDGNNDAERTALQNILYGQESRRGKEDCKSTSFFALIKKARDIGAHVLCGDSGYALNNDEKRVDEDLMPHCESGNGAPTDRIEKMNQIMSDKIKQYSKNEGAKKDIIILCGNAHLIRENDSEVQSLPEMLRGKMNCSNIDVTLITDSKISQERFSKNIKTTKIPEKDVKVGSVEEICGNDYQNFKYQPKETGMKEQGVLEKYANRLRSDEVEQRDEKFSDKFGNNTNRDKLLGENPSDPKESHVEKLEKQRRCPCPPSCQLI
jgi:hypothetical protein